MSTMRDRTDTGNFGGQIAPTGDALAMGQAGSPSHTVTSAATFAGFRCGQCGSEDIQRLSMVYESGTSTINARTNGTSTGFGVGRGGLGVGTAFNSSRTTGTQTSELAKRAVPPKAKLAGGWLVIGIIGAVFLGALSGIGGVIWPLGLCGYLYFRGQRYNRDVYPGLKAAWDQSWLCHRCGAISRIGA